ncbi:hypothetical protein TWF481_005381 [Arthrobotrys musiformis]|uniref:Uncharacterized protein n=1 Tax=Arthrobotrys musiformis TaxID=47236 RepID=A0AAV9WDL2_9PEZI
MTVGDILLIPLRFGLSVFLFLISPLTALLAYFFDLAVDVLRLPLWLVHKVEILYIYLGIAALAGLSLGLIFSFFASFIFSALNLDHQGIDMKHSPPPPVPSDTKRRRRRSLLLTGPSFESRVDSGFDIDIDIIEEEVVETSSYSLSPTSLSPDLMVSPSLFRGDVGRQRIFPIMEEEDEHEDEVRGRKGRGKKRS